MSRRCLFTDKRISAGRQYTMRGISKIRKGIGLKTTGKTKRWFRPNIQKKRIWSEDGNCMVKVLLSTNSIRTAKKYGVVSIEDMMRIHKLPS